jgi:hypothetical protein
MKTVIHTSTGKVLRVQTHNIVGQNETLINDLLTIPMIEPYFVNGEFIEGATPEQIAETQKEPVPTEVALWKLRFVLSQMQLELSVTDAINLLEEPQRTAATYIWNFGTAVDRDSNTVIFIKTALGFTEQEVDDIFIQANSIQL